MQTQIRWCSGCQDDQVFEVARCDDEPQHSRYAELCCTWCGLGVYDSVLLAIAEGAETATSRTAAA